MITTEIYRQLAIERCRMYVAQLCAANHLNVASVTKLTGQSDTVESLLKGLSQDLEVLEQILSEYES